MNQSGDVSGLQNMKQTLHGVTSLRLYSPSASWVYHGDKPNEPKNQRLEGYVQGGMSVGEEGVGPYPRLVHGSHLFDNSRHLFSRETVADHGAHPAGPGSHHPPGLARSHDLIGAALRDQVQQFLKIL
jgi:hypothetical protein